MTMSSTKYCRLFLHKHILKLVKTESFSHMRQIPIEYLEEEPKLCDLESLFYMLTLSYAALISCWLLALAPGLLLFGTI